MDWTNMEDWNNLPETLKQLGINVPESELKSFIINAKNAAGALEQIDLEAFTD
jgi:hypothetical protein